MPLPIESLTTLALGRALDAAALRHQAIAANIANHAVEGYVPLTVSFGRELAQARLDQSGPGRLDEAALAGMRPYLTPVVGADGRAAPVKLDAEMASMAQNAVQYQALVRGLSRHLSILATAAGDGRK